MVAPPAGSNRWTLSSATASPIRLPGLDVGAAVHHDDDLRGAGLDQQLGLGAGRLDDDDLGRHRLRRRRRA